MQVSKIVLAPLGCGLLLVAWISMPHTSGIGELQASPRHLVIPSDTDGTGKRRYSIELANCGFGELKILSVKGSCGCTLIDEFPSATLKPGQSSTISGIVSLPLVGSKRAQIDVIYSIGDRVEEYIIPISMSPRMTNMPSISEAPLIISLTSRHPGELIVHQFSFELVERVNDKVSQLQSVTASIPDVDIEILDDTSTRQINPLQQLRTVQCRLRSRAPEPERPVLYGEIEFTRNDGSRFEKLIPLKLSLTSS